MKHLPIALNFQRETDPVDTSTFKKPISDDDTSEDSILKQHSPLSNTSTFSLFEDLIMTNKEQQAMQNHDPSISSYLPGNRVRDAAVSKEVKLSIYDLARIRKSRMRVEGCEEPELDSKRLKHGQVLMCWLKTRPAHRTWRGASFLDLVI